MRLSRLRPIPSSLLAACLLASVSPLRASTPLRSPWDAQPVPVSQADFNCALIPLAADISVTGNLDTDGVSTPVKDAAYGESVKALHDFTKRVLSAADHYQRNGSQAAAMCVADQLNEAAENHAMDGMMASPQAWYEQNTAVRAAATAFLKVRPSGLIQPDQEKLIVGWMTDIVHNERRYFEQDRCSRLTCNYNGHRGLSAALAACSVGIAGNDRGLFHWCIDRYHAAVEHIDGRGLLPYDTKGHYALKYNLEAAGTLVQIADLGETNGVALYDYAGGRIHLLVHSVSRGLVDPSLFQQASRETQRIAKTVEPWEITWAAVYDRRFPDPVITALLQQVGTAGADMWGGDPWNEPPLSRADATKAQP